MPINPSNMRVVDVARLLNSTSQGFVLAQARLYRDFNRVGFRIAAAENARNINLLTGRFKVPPSMNGKLPRIPTTPPQERVPMVVPSL